MNYARFKTNLTTTIREMAIRFRKKKLNINIIDNNSERNSQQLYNENSVFGFTIKSNYKGFDLLRLINASKCLTVK